jgi:hypothetical protein
VRDGVAAVAAKGTGGRRGLGEDGSFGEVVKLTVAHFEDEVLGGEVGLAQCGVLEGVPVVLGPVDGVLGVCVGSLGLKMALNLERALAPRGFAHRNERESKLW